MEVSASKYYELVLLCGCSKNSQKNVEHFAGVVSMEGNRVIRLSQISLR